jgi:Kef-type K+ transport system membrane component KefB
MATTGPIPPLSSHSLLIFLIDLAVLLLLARSLGRLAEKFKMPAIVGELLTGLILGPSLLGHFFPAVSGWFLPADPEQMHLVDGVGQLGLLLLVGVTGAHLDLAGLRRSRGYAARVSLMGLIVPLALGVLLGVLLADRLMAQGRTDAWVFALFLGVAMCVTAIPVIAKTLSDMRLLHRNVGQLTLAAGMIDDAVGWFLLAVVSSAATVGVTALGLTWSAFLLLAFVAVAVAAGRPLVAAIMRRADRSPEPGPTVAGAVILLLIGAVATAAMGMEPIFGAFVLGILIGRKGAANQRKLAPLRTLAMSVLAPIFLATAGLRMDITALGEPGIWPIALAVLAVAIIGKFAGAFLGARMSRMTPWEGVALGAGMNARGVVEVIVALTGLRLGVLNTAAYTIIVLVAIVTSLMAPPLLRFAMARIALNDDERLRKIDHDAWSGLDSAEKPSAEEA